MRTVVSTLALLFFIVLSTASGGGYLRRDEPGDSPANKKDDAPLKVGNNLPGTFHPYNVTGPHKQHFHCLISEHGLEPMVMIFFKNADFSDPLPKLLKGLDAAIDKNPNTPFGAFVVFVPDDLPDAVGSNGKDQDTNNKNDDARLELEKKIDQNGADMKLKHVVLCLDHKSDVAKFGLRDDNLITVVLYKKLKVVAVHALPKSDFTEAAVEKIMADVADKLGAKRK
ncbi:MAG TPA: hypothetical protein VMF69_23780 [Gemmataceae bacterium]|nr:hypothetical protein [Gemmataceae bacterium]